MCLSALMCLNKGDYLVLCITCDFLLAQFNKYIMYFKDSYSSYPPY